MLRKENEYADDNCCGEHKFKFQPDWARYARCARRISGFGRLTRAEIAA